VLKWLRRSAWKISLLVPLLVASSVHEEPILKRNENYCTLNSNYLISSALEKANQDEWLPLDELMFFPFTVLEYADSMLQEVFLDDYFNILLGIYAAV